METFPVAAKHAVAETRILDNREPAVHSGERLDFIHILDVQRRVIESGLYNFECVREPVPTKFNIGKWRDYLCEYDDKIVCDYLEFGWPINYVSEYQPNVPPTNHASAIRYARQVDAYLLGELREGATMGPFSQDPFAPESPAAVLSPIQTVEKEKGVANGKRRVVIDLSYPDDQNSVNAGIPKDTFLGLEYQLRYGSFDDFADLVVGQGQGCLMFKRDLSRAFRQIYVCPSAYHLLGFQWQGKLYFDLVFPFGLRSACVACQRTTEAISYIYKNKGRKCVVFLDDFGSCARPKCAEEAFRDLGELLHELRVVQNEQKAVGPTTVMEFLGIGVDTVSMTCFITEKKMINIITVLDDILGNLECPISKRQLQSVAGKLHFLSKCCRPGRVFMSRLLALINTLSTSVIRQNST